MGTYWESHQLFLDPSGAAGDDTSVPFNVDTGGWHILRTLVDISLSAVMVQEDLLTYQAIAPTRWAIVEYGSALNPLPHFETQPDDGRDIHFLCQGQITPTATYSHRPHRIAGTASVDISGNLTYDLTVECTNLLSISGSDTADSHAQRIMLGGSSGLVLLADWDNSPSPPGQWRRGQASVWATVRTLFRTG